MAFLRMGSRGSQLALWQSDHVAAMLRSQGHTVEVEVIKTTGDKITDVALSQVGTKGMFTKEIEEALEEGRIDLTVHSLKDLPTEIAPAFTLAAIMKREDARDAFLSVRYDGIAALPNGALVGTSSLRRHAQLKALRRDLRIEPLRGNVDSRLRKLESGDYDAIILAASGLRRLNRLESVRKYFESGEMCPAAGQGALAIEIRSGDHSTLSHLQFMDDRDTRTATTCERAALNAMGGGCQVPIGTLAAVENDQITLTAVVARTDGSQLIRETQQGTDGIALGTAVGMALLKKGAQAILDDVYNSGAIVPQQP